MTAPQNSPSVTIGSIAIRQDADGRYSLKDLWKSAGGEQRHRPNYWLENQQTQDLIAELQKGDEAGIPATEQKQPVITLKGGNVAKQGTYVVRELVYAYAMWISPSFHLKVIRTFDAVMTGGGDGGGRPPIDTLLPSEAQTLKEIAHRKLADLPPELHGKALAELWSRVQRKFRVNTYTFIPREQLTDAIAYIMQMELHCAPAAPEPPPVERIAGEPLNRTQQQQLKRLVDHIARHHHHEQSWKNGVWAALRATTGTPAPERFQTDQLPAIASELLRAWAISESLNRTIWEVEQIALKRLIRAREDAEPILADLRAVLLNAATSDRAEWASTLERWQLLELMSLLKSPGPALEDWQPDRTTTIN